MAVYFADSSALVKRYVNETGSGWIRLLIGLSSGNRTYIARITSVEVVSAIVRRRRGRSISGRRMQSILMQFRHDMGHDLGLLDVTVSILTAAEVLAENHALRAYDAVQLAVALALNQRRQARLKSPVTLVSADRELNAAAAAEGLAVDDPNNHP